jgi:hypothetical protein
VHHHEHDEHDNGREQPGRFEDLQLKVEPEEDGTGRKRQQPRVAEHLVAALLHGFRGAAIGQTPVVFLERRRSGRVAVWHGRNVRAARARGQAVGDPRPVSRDRLISSAAPGGQ